jgi:sporulation protein YlmC with PRC-barrel domain
MIRASDLVGCKVRTTGGEKLGRVHDLRAVAAPDGNWRLTGLVVGKLGLLSRLAGDASTSRGRSVVPWQDIVELGDGQIVVRSDSEPVAPAISATKPEGLPGR